MEQARDQARAGGKRRRRRGDLAPPARSDRPPQGHEASSPPHDADKFHGRDITRHASSHLERRATSTRRHRAPTATDTLVAHHPRQDQLLRRDGRPGRRHRPHRTSSLERWRQRHQRPASSTSNPSAPSAATSCTSAASRGEIRVGDDVQLPPRPAPAATPIAANHTATHLLNLALREVARRRRRPEGLARRPRPLPLRLLPHGHALTPTQLAGRRASRSTPASTADLTVYADIAPLERGPADQRPPRRLRRDLPRPRPRRLHRPARRRPARTTRQRRAGTRSPSSSAAARTSTATERGRRPSPSSARRPSPRASAASSPSPASPRPRRQGRRVHGHRPRCTARREPPRRPPPRRSHRLHEHRRRSTSPRPQAPPPRRPRRAPGAREGGPEEGRRAVRGAAPSAARAIAELRRDRPTERVIVTTIDAGSTTALPSSPRCDAVQSKCPRAAIMLVSPDRDREQGDASSPPSPTP